MFSNVYKNLLADYKVKIDDIKTESILILTDLMKPVKQMQRRVWSLLFYSGKIYWKIELSVNAGTLNITDIEMNILR